MNNKSQTFALFIFIGLLFIVVSFVFIDPFKESLDVIRGGTSLNCIGTSDFNATSYNEQDTLEQLTKRPTCFISGISMVWFLFAWMFAVVIWVNAQIRRKK
jgi:hypothetical protein